MFFKFIILIISNESLKLVGDGMKNGVFLLYEDINNNTGVNRKIRAQIKLFKENGVNITPFIVDFRRDIWGYKILYRLPFANIGPVWKYSTIFDDIDFIYMRRPLYCNFWFLKFLRELKKNNHKMKIIYEIPTYPYDAEISSNVKNLPIYIKDKIARRFLYKYVDRIALLSKEKEVWGIKTLAISNGYDFEKQSLRKISVDKESIDIIAVALFDMWHGYERLIKGLADYYAQGGNRKIHIHFAGDGPELNTYKKIAIDFNVSKYCHFYGMQSQAQLDDIYDKCNLAVSSLGLYKKNLSVSRELKSREYLAKGLPIICSKVLDLLEIDELKSFLLEFPDDSTLINFERIVNFYDELYAGKEKAEIAEMAANIRAVATRYLDMNKAMSSVINYILY